MSHLYKAAHNVTGSSGADAWAGTKYKDKANGGLGNDVLDGKRGSDTLNGGKGNDELIGGQGADALIGGNGKDKLLGGGGKDMLTGGRSADTLSGGKGGDMFVFASAKDANKDRITDFKSKQGDAMDVSGIDAISGNGTKQDDTFTFIGDADFSNTAGELRYSKQKSQTLIQGDVDGDGRADFAVRLTQSMNLSADDFIL